MVPNTFSDTQCARIKKYCIVGSVRKFCETRREKEREDTEKRSRKQCALNKERRTKSVWLLFYRSRWILLPRRWEFYVLQYLRENSAKRQFREPYPGLHGKKSVFKLFSFLLHALCVMPLKFKCEQKNVFSRSSTRFTKYYIPFYVVFELDFSSFFFPTLLFAFPFISSFFQDSSGCMGSLKGEDCVLNVRCPSSVFTLSYSSSLVFKTASWRKWVERV
jgi:hypothetical protein